MTFCPLQANDGGLKNLCLGERCGWFCEEEGRCAIAALPSFLDWLTRFAVTKPYEEVEAKNES